MAATALYIRVNSVSEMQVTIARYVAEGYAITSQTPTLTTLTKPKRLNMTWVIVLGVVGFLFFLVPLAAYLIYYWKQKDEIVQIELVAATSAIPAAATSRVGAETLSPHPASPPQLSPDGRYWWDGSSWQPVQR